MYEYIKICIFIILYLQNVVSYKIYQLDPAEGSKLLPKINQLLQNQRNDEQENENVNVKNVKINESAFKPMGKSMFVKRKIPHGYTTGEYEYDSKLNTVFKPLARYHVKTPLENHELSILKDMEFDQRHRLKSDKDLIVLVQKEESQPGLLSEIQKYLNQNARQQKRKKKGRFQGLFNKYYDNAMLLREKSGEDNDPIAPGKLPASLLPSSVSSESVEKVVYPIYPFYNHWTYQKNIIQDRCPGQLVKVGNMCINAVGHRRSAASPRRSSHHKKHRSIRKSRKKHLYGSHA